MRVRRQFVLVASLGLLLATLARAQTAGSASGSSDLPLFAIEITMGPKWDQSKPAQEQPLFREHSTNLRRLRESGNLIMGARFADTGLIVVAAKDLAEAKAMMDPDPSIGAGTFAFEVHPFDVFYGGDVRPRPRR